MAGLGLQPTSFIGAPGVHAKGSDHYIGKAVDTVPISGGADYNPQGYTTLVKLIESGRFAAIGCAKEYVDALRLWAEKRGVRLFTDDPRYNRGTTGYHFHLAVR